MTKPKTKDEWVELFEQFKDTSSKTGEALKKAQDYIKDNYSFSLPKGATAYVYYGEVADKVGVWRIIGDISDKSHGKKGYISSTEAGMLFNDRANFQAALAIAFEGQLDLEGIADGETDSILYEGQHHTGEIVFEDGSTAQAFNDFFSQNYIENIRCANVHAIFAGDPVARGGEGYNCFIRVELNSILKNEHIKTINGIDKYALNAENILASMDEEGIYFITDTVKTAQVKECAQIQFSAMKVDTTDILVDTSPFLFADSHNLAIEMVKNGKIGDLSKSDTYRFYTISGSASEVLIPEHIENIRSKGMAAWEALAKPGSEEALIECDFDMDKMLHKVEVASKVKEPSYLLDGEIAKKPMHPERHHFYNADSTTSLKEAALEAFSYDRSSHRKIPHKNDTVDKKSDIAKHTHSRDQINR